MADEPIADTSAETQEAPSKKALKKAAAAAEKARLKAERAAALEAKMAALSAAADAEDPLKDKYGDAEMVQSQTKSGRRWTRVEDLSGTLAD